MIIRAFFVFLTLIAITPSANAIGFILDANGFYFSDSFVYSNSTSTTGRTFYDFTAGIALTDKKMIYLGWNYDSYTFSDNPGTAKTLNISDMGPKLIFYIDKDRTWVVALTYNLITNASYSSGATSSTLQGYSYRAEAGYTIHMTEAFLMGAKLNYYTATFAHEVTNTTTINAVSDSRTVIYPSFAFTYRFD
jgi:hypothetical protein